MEQKSVTRVKDIYVGKPDARDEFDTAGSQQFIEAFVMPPQL